MHTQNERRTSQTKHPGVRRLLTGVGQEFLTGKWLYRDVDCEQTRVITGGRSIA